MQAAQKQHKEVNTAVNNPYSKKEFDVDNYQGDVIQDDSQKRFLAQHSNAMLEQCCKHSKLCHNNRATLCCAKNQHCKSSPVMMMIIIIIIIIIIIGLYGTFNLNELSTVITSKKKSLQTLL